MANAQRFLPSQNPYGSGVLLSSEPYTQYHLNQQAKEQAKDEALDKYFQNIDSKINPAGMRTQEIGALLKQQNDDRDFYLKNKDAIKNPTKDNGAAYNEYMGRNQSKLAFIENSKKKGDIYKQMVPIFADPTKRALMGDEAIAALEAHDLPMTDPRHQEFDVTKLNYNPKPFDQVKYQAGLKPFVKEIQGETTFKNAPDYATSFQRTPVTKMNQEVDKLKVASFGELEYKQNPSLRKLVSDISSNPYEYEKYNKIYKQAFGKEFDIQHPEQIAAAYSLSLIPNSYTKDGKPEIDTEAQWKAHNVITSRQADSRARIRQQFAIDNQYSPQAHVQAIIENGTDTPTTYKVGDKWVGGKEIALPDEVEDKFYDKSNGKLVRPNKVLLDKDGKNVHLLYFTGEKSPTGSPLINEKKSRDIPIGTTLIPTLEKTFGNPKKNLYTNGSNTPSSKPTTTVTFQENGTIYNIPSDKVDAFMKAKPKAKRKS